MTISASDRTVKYVGNNTTDTYNYTFPIESSAELEVRRVVRSTGVETLLALTTDYTVTGVGSSTGGTVVLVAGNLAATQDLIISGDTGIEQDADIRNQSSFYPRVHENFFDRITRIAQEINEKVLRSIKVPRATSTAFDTTLPADLAGNVNKAITINATGDGFSLTDISAVTGAVTSLTGDVTGSGGGAMATTIANDVVTNAKLDNMATQTIKGRTTAGTGDPEDLTATQATAILNNFVGDSGAGGTKGLVPAPASGDAAANKFLNADGTWKTSGGTITGGTNLGASGSSVFAQVNGANMEFRKLIAGTNITLTENTNDITIDAAAGASGDVVGPASATDNRIALFDGATGKLIKEASSLISEVALLASPTFTGTPASTTAAAGTNTTQIATTAFVTTAISEAQVVGTFSGTSVTPTARARFETFVYNGGSAQTFSSTGFGTISSLTNGYQVKIIGSDNTNTLTIDESDISDGRIMTGPIELGRGMVICFEYNSTLSRMVELYRSANNG